MLNKNKSVLGDTVYPKIQIIRENLFENSLKEDICFISNYSSNDVNSWLKTNRHISYQKGKKYMDNQVIIFRNDDDLKLFLEDLRKCEFDFQNPFDRIDIAKALSSNYGDVGFVSKILKQEIKHDDNKFSVVNKDGLEQWFYRSNENVEKVEEPMNNIFKFATKELSLDAIIAWLFNGFNEGDNKEKEASIFAVRFYYKAATNIELNEEITKINIKMQHQSSKIDVFIEIETDNKKINFVFENKTNTSYHGNQLARHIECTVEKDAEVYYFYQKTGFMNWYDLNLPLKMSDKKNNEHNVKDKFVTINRGNLVCLFTQVKDASILSEMYLRHLLKIDDEENEIVSILNDNYIDDESIRRYFMSDIGNYSFISTIYEELKYDNELNLTLSNSIGGRAWSQIGKKILNLPGTYIFWRLDFRNKSKGNWLPYLSLREYRTDAESDRFRIDTFRRIYDELVDDNDILSTMKGNINNGGNQKEREIGIFFLDVGSRTELELLKSELIGLSKDFFGIVGTMEWNTKE